MAILTRKARRVNTTAVRGLLRGEWKVAPETVETAIGQFVASQRLVINSSLTSEYGLMMADELANAADVVGQVEVIQRFRSLVMLLVENAGYVASENKDGWVSTGGQMKLMKATKAAQSRGWVISWDRFNIRIESIRSA